MSGRHILINALSMSQGGGRSYVTNLLRELDRDDRGFRFTLVAMPGQLDGIDTGRIEVKWVRVPDTPRGSRVLWRVGYEQALLPLVARRFDLLYCVADLCPRYALAPTVVLLRNLNIYDRRWYDDRRTRTLARLARWGLPNARRILFPSQAAADLIARCMPVPEDRVRVVHYGISLDAFQQDPEPAAPDSRYLFLPAAVERHKNLDVLVECLPHVKDPELEVWIAGKSEADPGYRLELERRAAELGVGERLRFLGAVPYRDVLRYYRGAAAFVFPSYIETFGHPLLESMIVGTPVIASDIPAFREIAEDAALYFPVEDARTLAQQVDRVLGEPEQTRLRVERGRLRAAGFSWQKSVDGLCAVFDEVLAENGASPR